MQFGQPVFGTDVSRGRGHRYFSEHFRFCQAWLCHHRDFWEQRNGRESLTDWPGPAHFQHRNEEEDIDQELLRFLKETRHHRSERDKNNAPKGQRDVWLDKVRLDSDYVDLAKVGIHTVKGTVDQPSADKDELIREQRMKYGPTAEQVARLETLLTSNFEQCLDNCNPILWPNIPLRIVR